MKIIVTGAQGQVGSEVCNFISRTTHTVIKPNKKEIDLCDLINVKNCLEQVQPDIILHCAAYTKVDAAESNRDLCEIVNIQATKIITDYAYSTNTYLLFLSTDYVFPGNSDQPWKEEKSNGPALNFYGYTKLAAENYIAEISFPWAIIRTQWVFGKNGENFVKKILELSKTRTHLQVISDQIGSPTYSLDLAETILKIAINKHTGFFHATNSGVCSWYDFACEILTSTNKQITVTPIASNDYPTPAKRPINSRIDSSHLHAINISTRHWKDAITHFLQHT